jgi:hypothetical protein
MQAVIVHPGTVQDAVRSGSATRHMKVFDARRAILPSKTLEPLERLAVYQGMYPLRMSEALAADYPGLAAFMGRERFFDFVLAYVAVHPSRSYTFARLGAGVPEFLRKTRRFVPAPFLSDLARLEQAITEVFEIDEEEAGHAAPATPPLRHIATDWASRRFSVSPTLRLLSFRHAVGPALDALKAGKCPSTRPRASWTAVYRRRYAVYRLELGRGEFRLLSALAAGQPLGTALRLAARTGPRPLSAAAVRQAFRIWTSERILLN